MGALIDLTGRRFGRLEVLRRAETRYKYGAQGQVIRTEPTWLCRCDCGNERVILGMNLREGRSNSCGCLAAELRSEMMKARHRGRCGSNDHDPAAAPPAGADGEEDR